VGLARQVADRVVLVEVGRILEVQPPERLFDRPESEGCRALPGKIL
jgi:ABC-type histidine transport system ATPase subunit